VQEYGAADRDINVSVAIDLEALACLIDKPSIEPQRTYKLYSGPLFVLSNLQAYQKVRKARNAASTVR
jgi:hypothetical protein